MKLAALAISEPEGGSDVRNLRTRARRDGDDWIIDGHYTRTLPMRLARCDTLFVLDYPVEVCLEGVAARRGTRREDMPWVESSEDHAFTDFIRRFNADTRPAILEHLRGVQGIDVYHFTDRRDAERYLSTIG